MSTPKRSNCIIWAITKVVKYGGYLAIRKGKGWSPIHAFWVKGKPPNEEWLSYKPIKRKSGWRVLLDCIWFEGKIEKDD